MTDRDAKYPDSCPFYVSASDAAAEARKKGQQDPSRPALFLRAAILYAISAEGAPEHLPKWKVRVWTAAVSVARDGGFPSFAAMLAKKHLTKVPLEALAQREWLKMVLAEGGS